MNAQQKFEALQSIDCRSARTWIEDKPFREVNAKIRGKQATKGVNRCPMGDVPTKSASYFGKPTVASEQALRPLKKRFIKKGVSYDVKT